MPEGPSIVIAREELHPLLKNQVIRKATGHADIEFALLEGKKITAVRSWGKHLLICMRGITVRVHFLMFGTYRFDTRIRKPSSVKLELQLGKHTLRFYTCAVKLLEGNIRDYYDWTADTLDKKWSTPKAKKKLKDIPQSLACDALLDQDIFSGVGNIIKNEVLYRVHIHPSSIIENIPARKLTTLVDEARNYSHDFLKWKKEGTLKKHWLAYAQKKCKRCDLPFRKSSCGQTKRRTFYCPNCQEQY